MKRKKNQMMGAVKDTMGVGVASMAGYGVLGAMGSVPGMPAQAAGVIPIAGAGLQLANVGQLAKTGMTLVKSIKSTNPEYRKKFGNKNQERLKRMLN